jgi:uncharacterized coiled-coil protein SlyX
MVLLLVMVLVILIVIFIFKINKTYRLDRKIEENLILEKQAKQNKTIELLNSLVLEKNKQITQLENQVTELAKEKSKIIIRIFYFKLLKINVQFY